MVVPVRKTRAQGPPPAGSSHLQPRAGMPASASTPEVRDELGQVTGLPARLYPAGAVQRLAHPTHCRCPPHRHCRHAPGAPPAAASAPAAAAAPPTSPAGREEEGGAGRWPAGSWARTGGRSAAKAGCSPHGARSRACAPPKPANAASGAHSLRGTAGNRASYICSAEPGWGRAHLRHARLDLCRQLRVGQRQQRHQAQDEHLLLARRAVVLHLACAGGRE